MRRSLAHMALLLLGLLAVPVVAWAMPPNVTGLSAHVEDGRVMLHWEPPVNTFGITNYRVYFARQSILETNGRYDDFASTAGKVNDFVLTDLPPYPQIFLSVVAVDTKGDESASFAEEVRVDLSGGTKEGEKTVKDVPSAGTQQHIASTVGLTGAEPKTPISVEVTFTAPVAMPREKAAGAFTIIDAKGRVLPITSVIVQGPVVSLVLGVPQIPGMHYALRVNDGVSGAGPDGEVQAFDMNRSITTFDGYSGVGAPAVGQRMTTPVASLPPPIVLQQPTVTPSGPLSSSGIPIIGVMAASGAIAGWRRLKRKKFRKPTEPIMD